MTDQPTRDPQVDDTAALHRRIAELEAALAESRAGVPISLSAGRYTFPIDHTPDTIIVTRPHTGLILDVNDGFTRSSGYERQEVIGKNVDDLRLWADDEARVRFIQILRDHGECKSFENRFRAKDGRIMTALVSARITEIDGEPAIIAISRDITDFVLVQEQLRQSQRMEAVGQLTAGIAHNFNNLLQGIIASLAAAKLGAPEGLKKHLADAENTSQRGADIVKQLMLFTRADGSTESTPVDIVKVLDDTVAICHRTFDRKITVTLQPQKRPLIVIGDAGQLQQVFLNLCLNARDALATIEHGEPAIVIEAGDFAVPGERHYVEVSVADNGTGIPDRAKERIFEPFFTTKQVGEGTGLGLATAFGIVRQHDGSISCVSEVGKGSKFNVRLPIVDDPAEDGGIPDESQTPARGNETVLVIDDEAVIRDNLAAYLTQLGYSVLLASDGKEGLEIYRELGGEIALVLLDLSLPAMSGHEVLHGLRAMDPEAKVLIFTGYLSEAQQLVGMAPILTKPVRPIELANRMREALDA